MALDRENAPGRLDGSVSRKMGRVLAYMERMLRLGTSEE